MNTDGHRSKPAHKIISTSRSAFIRAHPWFTFVFFEPFLVVS
jgi:hypothetical protein